jgi:hypothetical protein
MVMMVAIIGRLAFFVASRSLTASAVQTGGKHVYGTAPRNDGEAAAAF